MLSIYNHDDPISFISEYIDYQKNISEDFTLRKWSQELGLKSTAPLIDVLKGKKKLKGKLLETLSATLPIDHSEMMYFQAITGRALSESDEKRLMYDLLISDLKPFKSHSYTSFKEQGVHKNLYAHWIYMAILTMAKLDNFEFTQSNIESKLRDKFDTDLIQEALDVLFTNGLLEKTDEGKIVRKYEAHANKTGHKIPDLESYFSMLCDYAKKAALISSDDRELQCFSMAIAKDKLPLAKEIIRKARKQLAALEEEGARDTVYQTNMMIFPLTK